MKAGSSGDLLSEIRSLIEDARQTATTVNVGLTALYWRIGNRILREVLGNERAAYGEQIVATLSRQLVADFGRGFESKSLHRMMPPPAVLQEKLHRAIETARMRIEADS
jgi:hypothetical protein